MRCLGSKTIGDSTLSGKELVRERCRGLMAINELGCIFVGVLGMLGNTMTLVSIGVLIFRK